MTGKQKRYLRSLAATMPAVVQIGKNSPEDKAIFQELADMLGAELVQVIGFNGVLYKAKKEPKIILPK